MQKLYKRIKRALHYHEAWADGAKVIEHWGQVGERGHTRQHKRDKKLNSEGQVEQVLSNALAQGYALITPAARSILNRFRFVFFRVFRFFRGFSLVVRLKIFAACEDFDG